MSLGLRALSATCSLRVAVPTVVALACGLVQCHSSEAPAPPRWHVGDGFIRDLEGRAVILRGVNLAGAHKAAPYFGFHQPKDFARLRDEWGMSSIRFLMTWAAIEPTMGNYDDAYLEAVATRIQWARDANLLVVLDMHDDVYGEGFAKGGGDGAPLWTCDAANYASFVPSVDWTTNYFSKEVTHCYDHFWQSPDLLAHFTEAWRRAAARLSVFDNVIGFDVLNEPYWGSAQITFFEQSTLQPFYESVVPKVREVAPNLLAFIEPYSLRNLGGETRLTPFPFGDVVYAPHSYDRDAESGKGFDPAHREQLMKNLSALASEAKKLNAALWIGEFGARAEQPGVTEYMTAQYDGVGAVASGAMYWAYDQSDGYALLTPDGKEKPTLVDPIALPYPERVAGTPLSYAFDAKTSTFTATYTPDRSITAPTLLSVPARVYPKGFSVECGGCTFTQTPSAVTIQAPAPGDTQTVTIHP